MEDHRQAVDLGLDHVLQAGARLGRQQAQETVAPGQQFVRPEHVAQAKDRPRMAYLGKLARRLARYALRWAVGREQLGVLGFQRYQLPPQRIVLRIGNRRIIKHKIAVSVVAYGVAQRLQAFGYFGHNAYLLVSDWEYPKPYYYTRPDGVSAKDWA